MMAGNDPGEPTTAQREYEFAILATDPENRGVDATDKAAEQLVIAGSDDATISYQNGGYIVDFARQAPSLAHALASAIADIERAGLRVTRIETDELVNLT